MMTLTALAAPVMTVDERKATEAFRVDLLDQFKTNTAIMWAAKRLDDEDGYQACVEENRRLYRDLKEVEFALETGTLPF